MLRDMMDKSKSEADKEDGATKAVVKNTRKRTFSESCKQNETSTDDKSGDPTGAETVWEKIDNADREDTAPANKSRHKDEQTAVDGNCLKMSSVYHDLYAMAREWVLGGSTSPSKRRIRPRLGRLRLQPLQRQPHTLGSKHPLRPRQLQTAS